MSDEAYLKLVQKVGNYQTIDEAGNALNAVIESLKESMVAKENVELEGLGTFISEDFYGRICYIPGTKHTIDPLKQVTLRLAFDKEFKKKINGGIDPSAGMPKIDWTIR